MPMRGRPRRFLAGTLRPHKHAERDGQPLQRFRECLLIVVRNLHVLFVRRLCLPEPHGHQRHAHHLGREDLRASGAVLLAGAGEQAAVSQVRRDGGADGIDDADEGQATPLRHLRQFDDFLRFSRLRRNDHAPLLGIGYDAEVALTAAVGIHCAYAGESSGMFQ